MNTHRNTNEIAVFIFRRDGVCFFQSCLNAVLALNGQERITRPRAALSPAFVETFAKVMETNLQLKLEVEHPQKEGGFKIHFKSQPSVGALKSPARYEITQRAVDEHYRRQHPEKPTSISLAVHANRSGLDVICWFLRSLTNVTFKVIQTDETIVFEPPPGAAHYSTPPLKKIVTEPAPPPKKK